MEPDEDTFYTLEGYPEDQAYFNDEDVEDGYEEAYASYLDARRRFAEIRASRGYYPVVALVDVAPQSGRDQQPVLPGSKGKTQKGATSKGKGAGGKPSGTGRGTTKGSTAKSRAAATKCLRCGQPGHWAAQCPKPPSTSSTTTTTMPPPQAKRPRGEGFVASGVSTFLQQPSLAPPLAFKMVARPPGSPPSEEREPRRVPLLQVQQDLSLWRRHH